MLAVAVEDAVQGPPRRPAEGLHDDAPVLINLGHAAHGSADRARLDAVVRERADGGGGPRLRGRRRPQRVVGRAAELDARRRLRLRPGAGAGAGVGARPGRRRRVT